MDLDSVLARLYEVPADDFVQLRKELATSARQAGDRTLADQIAHLRKPTAAAAIVNRQVHADPSTLERLTAVGDRLRAAQGDAEGIDRELLRDLSVERRAVVKEVSSQALSRFGASAGPPIHDEVSATFDAAVADPDTAARLGHLTRSEHWSGFGAVSDAAPGSRPKTAGTRTRSARPGLAAAEKRLLAAQTDLDEADEQVSVTRARVEELSGQLEKMQHDLTAAEKAARTAVTEQRSARSRHREAQAERSRAERRAAT